MRTVITLPAGLYLSTAERERLRVAVTRWDRAGGVLLLEGGATLTTLPDGAALALPPDTCPASDSWARELGTYD